MRGIGGKVDVSVGPRPRGEVGTGKALEQEDAGDHISEPQLDIVYYENAFNDVKINFLFFMLLHFIL